MSDAAHHEGSPPAGLARKLGLTAGSGLLTFAISVLFDNAWDIPLSDQLILSTLVGGVTLLCQFLVDFEKRLDSLELHQTENVREARKILDHGFTRVNEANRIFNSAPLIRDLAGHEIERIGGFLRSLSGGSEVFYEGEDREWLLGLTRRAQRSVSATSLATVDTGAVGFDGGLWKSDLGSRYLELQREAVERGTSIRRIFVLDRLDIPDRNEQFEKEFAAVRTMQEQAGIQVAVLDNSAVPERLKGRISDFIVFDQSISYETKQANTTIDRSSHSAMLETRLVLQTDRVQSKVRLFEELWAVAIKSETEQELEAD